MVGEEIERSALLNLIITRVEFFLGLNFCFSFHYGATWMSHEEKSSLWLTYASELTNLHI